jgi:phosphoribosyl 1,2-cyclic phosphodiesterase
LSNGGLLVRGKDPVAEKVHPFFLRFWGTRGSLPAPRAATNKYGGNTPCLEIRVENEVLIFDAGSGIRTLGQKLQKEFPFFRASIFLTHYHWDHIHGFPFFAPAFNKNNRFSIYGEPRGNRNVKTILSDQMALPYFPVPMEAMRAGITFKDVKPKDSIRIGSAIIKTESLNHPGKALSYRIEHGGKSIVYATDTEHGNQIDERLVRHAKNADLFIYDATYTEAEIRNGKKGWGHSSWREAVKLARAASVGQLLLFHHEPSRDDKALAAIENSARKVFPKTIAAREGSIHIP